MTLFPSQPSDQIGAHAPEEWGLDHLDANRTGLFTSAIISKLEGHQIALFSTGREHAGESLGEVLAYREPGRGPPIQMCDALSRNVPKPFKVILANCIAHGSRIDVNALNDNHIVGSAENPDAESRPTAFAAGLANLNVVSGAKAYQRNAFAIN